MGAEAVTGTSVISGCSTVEVSAVATKGMVAARYHGAPEMTQPRCALMNQAKVNEKRPGPINIAIARILLMAPCSSPCSEAPTRCVIIPCAAGPESDHRLITTTPIMKTNPVVAQPISAIPSAPNDCPT